jgi:hypothetical protein
MKQSEIIDLLVDYATAPLSDIRADLLQHLDAVRVSKKHITQALAYLEESIGDTSTKELLLKEYSDILNEAFKT